MKILIVDDDPIQRRLLRAQLSRLGYDVREVANGELAWQLLLHEPFPLVITDWMMPTLDGPQLIHQIRTAELPSYTYVILLTAKDGRTDVVAGLDAGADDYLIKPVDPHELRARVTIAERIVDLESRLREARDTDSLTGLRNRRALVQAAAQELARAARQRLPLGVLLLDVDHFKRVNDEHGHQAGDIALHTLARALEAQVRPYDLVGRWGGEEILVLLPGTGDLAASAAAERIRAAIAATPVVLPDQRRIALTVSVGVACSSALPSPTLEGLVQLADIGLYRAKQRGRNQVVLMSEDAAEIERS